MPTPGTPTAAPSASPGRALLAAVAAVVALVAVGPAEASAADARPVPRDFFGVHLDGPGIDGTVPLARELRAIRRAGTGTVRVGVFWNEAQPYRTTAEVPAGEAGRFVDAGGVPTDLSRTDRIVGAAADAGLRVLPVVQGTPPWATEGGPGSPNVPPRSSADYARYVRTLVARYGSRGSFWRGRPRAQRRTVRGWQVWNEPNLVQHWTIQPFARRYTALLRAAHRAIAAEDPRADVYLAGLTSSADVPAWTALQRVYEAGGRRAFDVIALHPYTRDVSGVTTVLARARGVAARAGDRRKPIALTEVSWSSSAGDSPDAFATWDTGEAGQARRLTQVMRALARRRAGSRIELVSWYTWLSPEASRAPWSRYSGLSRLQDGRVVRKPALAALVRVVRELRR